MDQVILKSYVKDSCFYIETEDYDREIIAISEKPNAKITTENRREFWANIVKFLDGESVMLALSGVEEVCFINNIKVYEKMGCVYLKTTIEQPKIVGCDRKFFLKMNIKPSLDDHFDWFINTLESFGCLFKNQKVCSEDEGLAEFTIFIPLKSIIGMGMNV